MKKRTKSRFNDIILTDNVHCCDMKSIMDWYEGGDLDLTLFKKIIIDGYHYITTRDCTRTEIMSGEIGKIYAMATNKPIS